MTGGEAGNLTLAWKRTGRSVNPVTARHVAYIVAGTGDRLLSTER